MKYDSSILQEDQKIQWEVARTTKIPNLLDILANSSSEIVRMTAVMNPNVSTETLRRIAKDENKGVRLSAKRVLESRGIVF